MITILFSHPWHGSFNHAILSRITEQLTERQTPYQLIDLVADGFNPVMTADDLRQYSRGGTSDPLVAKYGKMLTGTDELYILFPIWWGMMPAILKGFFDKVLLKGTAMSYTDTGAMLPLLNIGRTHIITTSQGPTDLYRPYIEGYLIPYVLTPVGITGAVWRNCDQTSHGPADRRTAFLTALTHG